MEILNTFFETSTIHGLSYWTNTKRLERLLWISIVLVGFTGAVLIIQQSFQSWNDSPIKTTIETLPIEKVTFPKITVCPPKDTYTNLNFDIIKAENITTVNEHDREILSENFKQYFLQLDYELLLKKLKNSFKENNQYRNWYTRKRFT